MRFFIGLRNGILISVFLWCGIIYAYAQVEKVDDYNYKTTKSVTQTYELKQRKKLIEALKKDIERIDEHKIQLQNQIADIEKEVDDAEKEGVLEKLVTEM